MIYGDNDGMIAVYSDYDKKVAYIPFLWVDKSCQGHGISKTMLAYLHGALKNGNYTVIGLEVRKDNARAFNLYSSMGYRTKEDRGEKILMEKTL